MPKVYDKKTGICLLEPFIGKFMMVANEILEENKRILKNTSYLLLQFLF